ncbi:MAG: hypothetical protein M3Z85_10440, partial [Acidobacteriota bacterium]|nr:hypothetical protein [Acidobacteriota bacterium]
ARLQEPALPAPQGAADGRDQNRICRFHESSLKCGPPRILAQSQSFINFYLAGHLFEGSGVQRKTNPAIHEPSGFLTDSEIAAHFVAADSVVAVYDQPNGGKPFI